MFQNYKIHMKPSWTNIAYLTATHPQIFKSNFLPAFLLVEGRMKDFISWMIYAMISGNMCDTCVDERE